MNPPDPSGLDGNLPRLAGYADGELDEQAKRQVADWIETDPEAAELLRDQEQFSPANTEFWSTVAPPQPDEPAWDAVRRSLADRLIPATMPALPARGWNAPTLLIAAAGVAAALIATWLAFSQPETQPTDRSRQLQPVAVHPAPIPREVRDPLAEFAALELAEPDEVFIEAILGNASDVGFAADSPCCDAMPLAGSEDVTLLKVQPGPRGRIPASALCPRSGDAPMVYAAGPSTR